MSQRRTYGFSGSPRPAWSYALLLVVGIIPIVLLSPEAPSPHAESPAGAKGVSHRVIAWNDLGMHCIDPDFSVFSILPPFNTLNAQVTENGELLTSASGYSVTFESMADANGSINTTSAGKTNFWEHVQALFGTNPPVDVGLTGTPMPGLANTPRAMTFHSDFDWFQGEGIPLTPIDDAFQKNPYLLMKVVVRNPQNAIVASTVTSVPVSQELECSVCHESGGSPFAKPAQGWVFHPDPLKDNRLNILRLHDQLHLSEPTYTAALQTAGYQASGLFDTVVNGGTPILCSRCHGSNALPGTGLAGISPLTQAIHGRHSGVKTPDGKTLDQDATRQSCFLCHPGRDTQCLRGAMGSAIGADGQHSMHCQSCHGDMAAVGDPNRVGWFDQPTCQNCHAGTATNNPGQIRYTSAFDSPGHLRVPSTNTFATSPNTPATGVSLYRFSKTHHGLQCSACHGPPHAIYPTAFDNDNVQSGLLQGHKGTVSDCSVCHDNMEDNENNGPHGMHPVNQHWVVDVHKDAASQQGLASCRACHGVNYEGTVLSRAQGDRTYSTPLGTKTFFRGEEIGCYACHQGPNNNNSINNAKPVVTNVAVSTPNDVNLAIPLSGTDANGDALTLRIVSQPRKGTVAFDGMTATYLPKAGFVGTETFTYAARDGKIDSDLGTVTINVTTASCSGTIEAYGFGCPGSGDVMPTLRVLGCPEPGGALDILIENGLGGAPCVLGFGGSRNVAPLPFGCVLRIGSLITASPLLTLDGTGAGNGTLTLPVSLPSGFPAGTYTLQAFIADANGPGGFTSTNGVEVTIQ